MNNTSHHIHSTVNESNLKLAVSATLHCLIGCGIGEVVGMIISTISYSVILLR